MRLPETRSAFAMPRLVRPLPPLRGPCERRWFSPVKALLDTWWQVKDSNLPWLSRPIYSTVAMRRARRTLGPIAHEAEDDPRGARRSLAS